MRRYVPLATPPLQDPAVMMKVPISGVPAADAGGARARPKAGPITAAAIKQLARRQTDFLSLPRWPAAPFTASIRAISSVPELSSTAYEAGEKVPARCQYPVKPLNGPPTTWLLHVMTKAWVPASYVPVRGSVRPGCVPPGLGDPWLK
jgi:hypothetical protein